MSKSDDVRHCLVYFIDHYGGGPEEFGWCPITVEGELCDGLYDLFDEYGEFDTNVIDDFETDVSFLYRGDKFDARAASVFQIAADPEIERKAARIWYWFTPYNDEEKLWPYPTNQP